MMGSNNILNNKVIHKKHTIKSLKFFQPRKKMVLDAALLSTQHYKVRTKDKVEQSRECSSAIPYTSV